jgi:ABC-type glycerol-3-phosphate transport system substrate-binding protein
MKNRNRHHPSRIIPVVLLTAALLTGCGGSAKKQSAEVSASAEPTPSAETVTYTGEDLSGIHVSDSGYMVPDGNKK